MNLIVGITNAAEFIGCNPITIHRKIEEATTGGKWNEDVFPKPVEEKPQRKGILRIWKAEDLKKYIPLKRGRPKSNIDN